MSSICHGYHVVVLVVVREFIALNVTMNNSNSICYYDLSYLQEHIHDDVLFLGFPLKDEAGQYIAQYQVDKDTLPIIMTDDNEVFNGENTI